MHEKIIEEIKKKYFVTQQELADELVISKQFMSKIVKGISKIPKDKFKILINKYKVRKEYLHIGEGEIFSEQDIKQQIKSLIDSLDKQPLKYKIPVLSNIYASAGNGCYTQSEDPTEYIEIDEIDVKTLNLNVEHSDFIIARGDSMYPTIFDGDKILVDKSKNEIMDGKIYVIRRDDLIMVKRLQRLTNGVKIISDNNTYDSYKLNMDDFKVCGRVLRVIKDV